MNSVTGRQEHIRTTMTKQEYLDQHIIFRLINYASSALQLNISELKKKFRHFPICQMDYVEKDLKEDMVEIRFDNEQATLSCMFDKDSKCDCLFLFFDDSDCLNDYIAYLNSVYTYDYKECHWQLPDCYLTLKKTERDMCMLLYSGV